VLLFRSRDYGRTWSKPKTIEPPLAGPEFELCAPVTPLSDGRWLWPTSTWCDWKGRWPSGKKMVAFVSHDRGRSWPDHMDVMVDPKQRVRFWESKIVELKDGRLLAAAWAYDETAAKDLPNQYAVSADGGKTWSKPASTGLQGQTMTSLALDDGGILTLFRRIDKTGLWANRAHLKGSRWVNDEIVPLWGANVAGLTSRTKNMAHNFNVLRFGAPCLCRLKNGGIFVAFWCYEDCVSNIRWFKLKV
jgi:sialidase-1